MSSETTGSKPGRRIDIPSVPNLRDIGGYAVTGGGRVKMGQLYRSVELSHLHGDDLAAMARLGIRTVFDLRTAAEREAEPDVLPPGAEQIVCDVLADEKGAAPATLYKVLGDPAAAREMLGGGKATQLFERGYRETVGLPSALSAYRMFFETTARDERRPALFHCTTGKDRTGWAAASTLLFLGVSQEDVLHDYLLSNRDLLPALKTVYEHFRAAGGDPHLLDPVFGVDEAYLRAALDEMTQRFGSIEGYFSDGLRIDQATQQALREALVDRAA
jgi:protein-tyrosine phosphatase